jgi:hypothetical protein
MSEQAEFDIAVSEGPSSNLDISMSELEKELEDLELEDIDNEKENPVLPEVPGRRSVLSNQLGLLCEPWKCP